MAKLLYSASMSLDGFIAGPGGDMSWLTGHLGPNPTADKLIGQIGALLIGNRTFGGDDPNRGTDQEGAFGGRWSGPQFVLTHHVRQAAAPGVVFLDDLSAAVAEAKAAAGEKYVNILGASVGRQCLHAGLLDEILVFVVPVLLGDGVRLFDQPAEPRSRLNTSACTRCRMPPASGCAFCGDPGLLTPWAGRSSPRESFPISSDTSR